jgi:hypothetical protein
MSFWFYGKDKDAKRTLTSVSVAYESVIALVVALFALAAPFMRSGDLRGKTIPFAILVVAGFVSLTASKIPQFQRGEWHTWGMRYMGTGGRVLYVLGYVLMVLGILGILALC